jgi:RNA recognition motif-containing protein
MNDQKNVLFVGNLSWNVNDDMLAEFFTLSELGIEPKKDESGKKMAKVILDRERGNRSKGFGFVTFETEEDAEKAMNELNGKMLDNREVRIQVRQPKPQA